MLCFLIILLTMELQLIKLIEWGKMLWIKIATFTRSIDICCICAICAYYYSIVMRITDLLANTKNVCFVLFGKHAQRKKILIDKSKHFIVESIHPSPQIAYSGFFNSNIFKKIEKYVGKINWQN